MTAEAINQQLSPLMHHDNWQPELFLAPVDGPDKPHLHLQHSLVKTDVLPSRFVINAYGVIKRCNIGAFKEKYPTLHVAVVKQGTSDVQMLGQFGLS